MNEKEILGKKFFIGNCKEVIASAGINYVTFNSELKPAVSLYHRTSKSGLTEYYKYLERDYFPIIRYTSMTFKDLYNYEYPYLAITNKSYHLVRDFTDILSNNDYELLNSEELDDIYKAIGTSYNEYIKLKNQYLIKIYKYIPKFMTYLFFSHFNKLVSDIDKLDSNYIVYNDLNDEKLKELNYKLPFDVSYTNIDVLLNYINDLKLDKIIRLFNMIDRDILLDDTESIYIQLQSPVRFVKGENDRYYTFHLDDRISSVYVELNRSSINKFLCFYKDGNVGFQEDIIYYHTPFEDNDSKSEDVFVEVIEE